MQFKITLRCLDANPVLPVNYQYELSAWIYRVIRNADAEYADFLHRHGHTTGRKTFKLCQTQVRGWMLDLELDAPRELLELGLLAGFGRMNGEGFGFGEIVRNERRRGL